MTATPDRDANGTTLDELSVEGRRLLAGVERGLFGHTSQVGLGRFVLLDVLGRGGMSVVYRAYDPKLDRRVAVKVMASTDQAARARMLREAKLLAQLSHPHVVTIHEVGEDRSDVFVAMEFVDGGTLLEWCREHAGAGRSRTRRLLGLCHQAIDGLAAAHALGIVHRDIKPANLLVGSDGRLRVADFGLARAGVSPSTEDGASEPEAPPEALALTATGAVVGTPAYMPPEQFRGEADARSDQFSFCASFYEAFCGVRPYPGTTRDALLEAIEAGRLASPTGSVPAPVLAVLRRGLRARPEERFEDMRALGRALRRGEQRRRWIGSALGVALTGGGVALATIPRPVPPCTDDRARIEAVVDPHRGSIDRALLGSGAPFVEEIAQRVSTSLDRLVDRWAEQRLEGCRLARGPEPELAAAGARIQACLDESLARIDESLGSVDTVTPAAARGFVDYLSVLFDVADCEAPHRDSTDSALGRELVAVLHRGELADAAFEPQRAREAFERVLARTEPGLLPRLRARAHLQLSKLDTEAEHEDRARQHAIASLDEAQAARDPERIAQAWVHLSRGLPDTVPWEAVDVMLGRARRLERAGELSERTAATLAMSEARIRLQYNHPTEAARLLRSAIARGEPIGHEGLPEMYLTLAMVDMMEGDLEAANKSAERSLALCEARYGPRHPMSAVARYRLANVQGFRGEIEQAERTITPAIEILARWPDHEPTNLVKMYSMRGDIRRNLRRFEPARQDYERSIEQAVRAGGPRHPELSTIYGSLAEMHDMQERHEEALAAADRSIELFDGTSMYARGRHASTMILRAEILADLGRDDQALAQIDQALPVLHNAFPADAIPHIQAVYSLARVLVDLERYPRAIETVDAYLEGDTPLDPTWQGRMQTIRARSLAALGDDAEAERWARRAIESLRGSDIEVERTEMEALVARLRARSG